MAARTPTDVATYTFSSTTADTVTFQQAWAGVRFDNHDTANEAWVEFGGGTAAADTANSRRVEPGGSRTFYPRLVDSNNAFSVVGNGGSYTIEGLP